MKALKLVHPARTPPSTRVDVDIRLKGTLLSALFRVRSDTPSEINPALATGSSQWGLWDWDVVELFVSCAPGGLPYYEFQVSPLGQHFELEVFEPRKRFNRDYRSGLGCAARATGPGQWEGELSIPLERLGWNGDPAAITGNAFAILGPKGARTYWSLFLEPQEKPDFHLPQAFRALL